MALLKLVGDCSSGHALLAITSREQCWTSAWIPSSSLKLHMQPIDARYLTLTVNVGGCYVGVPVWKAAPGDGASRSWYGYFNRQLGVSPVQADGCPYGRIQ